MAWQISSQEHVSRAPLSAGVGERACEFGGREVGRFSERFRVPKGWDAAQILPDGTVAPLLVDEAVAALYTVLTDSILAGSNAAFDARFLTALFRRHGYEVPWHYRPVCVATLAAGRLYATQPDHPALAQPWRSYDLSEALGVPRPSGEAAHTALGDARWARDLFDAVTGGAR